ncbi:steroidogenic acute regulatory protein, mitochondrial [Nelusetta ayraudi]|uniref:steroidogenic acute regulatory protein, mitochondrial n=1 Tax=Nelusetta ayraudi TaxID=303726 RepID=UPI003F72938D
MLSAVVKLCCGISYAHLRSMAGLQRTALAVIGQEITHLQRFRQIQRQTRTLPEFTCIETSPVLLKSDQQSLVQQGQEAMREALRVLEQKEGWKVETVESDGDVISSKAVAGARRVFRLEAILEAGVEELYDLLFLKVEEMHRWNPSVQQVKVLKHLGPGTIITHEVSAPTAGNLIGQRDFLSVRHSCKHDSSLYLSGTAIQLESFPPQAGFVRAEDGPTCIIIRPLGEEKRRSHLTWLLNMDVKGWLPKSIVNQALPRAQLDFTRHVRRRLTAGRTPR